MKLLVAHGKIPRPSCLSRHSEPEFEKIVLQLFYMVRLIGLHESCLVSKFEVSSFKNGETRSKRVNKGDDQPVGADDLSTFKTNP